MNDIFLFIFYPKSRHFARKSIKKEPDFCTGAKVKKLTALLHFPAKKSAEKKKVAVENTVENVESQKMYCINYRAYIHRGVRRSILP